ncbi:LacI family DNA-binding transcriptional regulator [Mycobacterium sp. NAZ190054]|uniref:LacI family DNA-binding transcriptional regulator n=1 Tax=Mycobacterium sp. NAZ190054 TaxID=1747766 RepID=UPI0007984984|nr:LacI family DNA-binding transcriptional regulator [Mycobacterium sp. NAZ190054]KWX57110.1 LacI family transcriptional regulator [Mycobacterium sp. NAZ190054]
MAFTSHDVAKLAGVSQSTVSRALRGVPGIAPETVARVREAARTLSYVPSEAGRTLSTRQARSIGVFTAELTNPFYPALVEPMRARLAQRGYRTILLTESDDAAGAVESLPHGVVDGVIIATAHLGSQLPAGLRVRNIPFVLVNRSVDGVECDRSVVDNIAGGRLAAEFLTDLGHRDIAAIFGPADTSTGRDREFGFRIGLGDRAVAMPDGLIHRGPFSYDTGYRCTSLLLESPTPPTAIFCGNDVIALGALNAARARGRHVGRDLSIIGFDDIDQASWELIDLTTIRCDLTQMAQTAADLVVDRITAPDAPYREAVLEPSVVSRGSHHRPG